MVRTVLQLHCWQRSLFWLLSRALKKGTVRKSQVHSKFLEGNLEGDLPDAMSQSISS